jgi:hypothetical protein
MCGIDVSTLNKLELGLTPRPSERTCAAILDLLKQWENEPPPKQPEMRGRWNFARDAIKGSR